MYKSGEALKEKDEQKLKIDGGKKGTFCDICTGCGRCAGVGDGMSIVTASRLKLPQLSLKNDRHKRLVTVDIGTTTIAMQLYDENGAVCDEYVQVNPQTEYGADVISRIWAAGEPEKAAHMCSQVRSVLGKGYEKFKSRLSCGEGLLSVLAANTTMVYLLMGYDAEELGRAPFDAKHLEYVQTVVEGVETVIMPGFSAFVGGDIASGLYACEMAEREGLTLFIDLGTNGEMALGNKDRITACATAAGPAFEGGVNRGVWGSDMVKLLAELKRRGIMDGTGLLADEYFDNGILIGNVRITQDSIRAIQLAKAAIAAGIDILMREYGAEYCDIERVILAGGFGYYLNPQSAAVIGLIPAELEGRTVSGGNTSLMGCLRLGANIINGNDTEKCMREVVPGCGIKILNLALETEFSDRYIEAMNFE